MSARQRKQEFAYVLCDGVVRKGAGIAGLGIVLRDGCHQLIARHEGATAAGSPARAKLSAIAEALRICRSEGIRRMTVYCHDPDVVAKVTDAGERDGDTRAGCLEVRALMNAFQRVEIRALPWLANLEASWLARDAARRTAPEPAGRLQPTLPLDAA